MSGMKLTLLLALLAMVLWTALFYAGVPVAPFQFALVHLLFLVLAVWFSGYFLMGRDPSRGFGELLRAGFQASMAYALLLALFILFFYKVIDPDAFVAYNERLIQGFVDQGHPLDVATQKVNSLYNAGNYAVLTFFGLLMSGAMNAVAFGLVHDKLLRRFRG
jgi:hypothetical protein